MHVKLFFLHRAMPLPCWTCWVACGTARWVEKNKKGEDTRRHTDECASRTGTLPLGGDDTNPTGRVTLTPGGVITGQGWGNLEPAWTGRVRLFERTPRRDPDASRVPLPSVGVLNSYRKSV